MSFSPRPQKMSRRAEEATAKQLGGKRVAASGATKWAKGDVKSQELLIERKDTRAMSYTLQQSDLLKHRQLALNEDRVPVFIVGFAANDFAVVRWPDLVSWLKEAGVIE